MRAIDLKTLVLAIYYKTPMDGNLREVPDDVEYDPDSMIRRTFDYRLNIKSIMSAPPQSGTPNVIDVANIDDIRKSVAILTELKKTPEGSPLVLEDEDFNYLVSRIKAARWAFIDEGILQFVSDIEHTVAMNKERIAAAVASAQEPHRVEAADPTGPPVSLIDAKASRNGKQREHAKR